MKKMMLILTLVFFGCASDDNREKSPNELKAEIYYGNGSQCLVEQRYTEALENLLQAETYSPKDSKIQNNLGMAFYFKEQVNKAIEHLKKAIDLDEKNSDAKNNLASIYFQQGNVAQAKKLYLEVQDDLVYSNQFRVQYNLGLIAMRENKPGEAYDHFRKAYNENDLYCPASFMLGKLEAEKGNYQQAYEYYLAASKGTCVKNPTPLYLQAEMLLHTRNYDHARKKYLELLQRFPKDKLAKEAELKLSEIDSLERKQGLNIGSPRSAKNNTKLIEEIGTTPDF